MSKVNDTITRFQKDTSNVDSIFKNLKLNSDKTYSEMIKESQALISTTDVKKITQDMVKKNLDGISTIQLPNSSGKVINWNVEKKVKNDILNDYKEVAKQSTLANCEELNTNLVMISTHSNARPGCFPFQDKIFSLNGTRGTCVDYDGNKYSFIPLEETTYGTAAGLLGSNCGHQMYPFIAFSVSDDNEDTNEKTIDPGMKERVLVTDEKIQEVFTGINNVDLKLFNDYLNDKNYTDDLRIAFNNIKGKYTLTRRKGSYFSPSYRTFNLAKTKGIKQQQTFVHELGHLLEWDTFRTNGKIIKAKNLYSAEVRKKFESYHPLSSNKEYLRLRGILKKTASDYSSYEEYVTSYNTAAKAMNKLMKELGESVEGRSFEMISDIYSGAYLNKLKDLQTTYHSTKYWQQVDEHLYNETITHMFSAKVTNDKVLLDQIEDLFGEETFNMLMSDIDKMITGSGL